MLHGEDVDPLLRAAPPPEALAWAARAAGGPSARVMRVWPLEGGTSSAIHALDVHDRGGAVRAVVLRRYVRADWLAEEPDVPAREATALELIATAGLAAPRLVAVDADGRAAGGTPAVLMTRLPGRIVWRPDAVEPFLAGLARALAAIHAVVPASGALASFDDWGLRVDAPPSWARDAGVWRDAFACFAAGPPVGATPDRLLHRDFHPGNVLWSGGAVTGVVDWPNASLGDPAVDLGICRWNLARSVGLPAADRLLALAGRAAIDPYWDVVAALGGFSTDELQPADEPFLAHVLRG